MPRFSLRQLLLNLLAAGIYLGIFVTVFSRVYDYRPSSVATGFVLLVGWCALAALFLRQRLVGPGAGLLYGPILIGWMSILIRAIDQEGRFSGREAVALIGLLGSTCGVCFSLPLWIGSSVATAFPSNPLFHSVVTPASKLRRRLPTWFRGMLWGGLFWGAMFLLLYLRPVVPATPGRLLELGVMNASGLAIPAAWLGYFLLWGDMPLPQDGPYQKFGFVIGTGLAVHLVSGGVTGAVVQSLAFLRLIPPSAASSADPPSANG